MQQLLLMLLSLWKPLALEGFRGFPKEGQVQRVVVALVTMIKFALTAPRQPGKHLEPCLECLWQLLNMQAPKPSGC